MLVFASLHTHPENGTDDGICTECVHHQCGGHLVQHSTSMHACVLCQFLSLPMLTVAIATLILYNNVCQGKKLTQYGRVSIAHNAITGLRAPPAFSL